MDPTSLYPHVDSVIFVQRRKEGPREERGSPLGSIIHIGELRLREGLAWLPAGAQGRAEAVSGGFVPEDCFLGHQTLPCVPLGPSSEFRR